MRVIVIECNRPIIHFYFIAGIKPGGYDKLLIDYWVLKLSIKYLSK
jgi:hypothetical protein